MNLLTRVVSGLVRCKANKAIFRLARNRSLICLKITRLIDRSRYSNVSRLKRKGNFFNEIWAFIYLLPTDFHEELKICLPPGPSGVTPCPEMASKTSKLAI